MNEIKELTIVCKEYDKYGNSKPITYIVKRNVTERDIKLLRIRGCYNPELQYYVMDLMGTDEEIIQLAKTKCLREPFFIRL